MCHVQGQLVYLYYDTVHLVKNIQNNLPGNKLFIFPTFEFHGFDEDVVVTRGEISRRLLHEVHDAAVRHISLMHR